MSDEYDAKTCVTAGELRAAGIPVPETIPDCGWVPRGSYRVGSLRTGGAPYYGSDTVRFELEVEFIVPFRWVHGVFTIDAEEKKDGPT